LKIEISHLSQSFGEHKVLKDINYSSGNIRALSLIGPSGGGKSSLLRIFAGLSTPVSGSLIINSQAINFDDSSMHEHRKNVGTVFQSFNLFPHLTGLENILLPLEKVHGLLPEAAMERAMSYLKRFRLEDHANKKPSELSGGQRQRIAIVRAVAIQPQLLLFDEPTSALDPEMTAEVLRLIEELKEDGRDFILVTHEMSFAKRVSDEVLFIADGMIAASGTTQKVFQEPSPIVKVFFDKILV
jgi:polar amino acid transport system ATP-binding protein